ncbi:MAG: thymidine phosphorylase [Acidobacteria bacterium]|nr:thymidine phosphorylase [Acidobacteriota bacterium]
MRVVNLIQRKRDGGDLTREEIEYFLKEYTAGNLPDYQASALLMAIFFSGLTEQEQLDWTESLLSMAPAADLSDLPGPKIGKHSTGGVGDKTSFIVGPLAACAGITVPMTVGRGLAHTGGTLDKVQSIPGFSASLKGEQLKAALRKTGVGLINPMDNSNADQKLESLRDATGTVESIPLIAISILSRELATGVEGLIADVKTGSGSLAKKMTDSRRLAQSLVTLGKRLGKKVVSVITDMDQPLGNAIGNALEIMEAVEAMRGAGPSDLVETSLELASRMAVTAYPDRTLESAKEQMFRLLNDGSALQKFRQMVEAQGGNPQIIDSFELLPNASAEFAISSPRAGYVSRISADDIGQAVMLIGAGRTKLDAKIDPAVGIVLEHKVGDRIQAGERLCTIYYNDEAHVEEASQMVEDAFHIASTQPEARPLIHEIIQ